MRRLTAGRVRLGAGEGCYQVPIEYAGAVLENVGEKCKLQVDKFVAFNWSDFRDGAR